MAFNTSLVGLNFFLCAMEHKDFLSVEDHGKRQWNSYIIPTSWNGPQVHLSLYVFTQQTFVMLILLARGIVLIFFNTKAYLLIFMKLYTVRIRV